MTDKSKAVRNPERVEMVKQAIAVADCDAVVCALPVNVLMMSGYWPVVGTSLVVATREGAIILLVPEDEKELTENSWADEVRTYQPNSLHKLQSPVESAGESLHELLHRLGLHCSRIGYEFGPSSEPSSYAAMNLYGTAIVDLLRIAAPSAPLAPVDKQFVELAAIKTPVEIERLRLACSIAGTAFEGGVTHLRAGLTEMQVAVLFRAGLCTHWAVESGAHRADGFAHCMSGPNSALASGAYARTRAREIKNGDFVLMHCNSYVDGYWTDITRTYVVRQPDERQQQLYEAVFAARAAALAEIKPGVKCSQIDRAARELLSQRGFGEAFKHSTGHGVGFAAISANAHPRLHPLSSETLQTGMVFNLEPAVYFEGYGGLRHCDMIAVTQRGAEVLTPFQQSPEELIVR